ncbi:nucleotide sugar dehydrogenase [Maribellus maritimus]|uniref:nucleotide sugar dehydrogenase n=1 Tax=Maribellus maritimus TaxID=2870838 RepID=UPI001EEB29E7|nr:nucleotide sugar dehydrogenase [Maribellus maritimus]MCG6191211.1 nucleotide sugar dehydrogenase [Maribellus maritimus]
MNYKNQILKKIAQNREVVGIIGLGYVGLPLAVNFAGSGVKVFGFEQFAERVNKINRGENYISDVADKSLQEVVLDNKTLIATSDYSKISECDAIIICVPTPLDRFHKPDMSYIESACIETGKNIKPGTFICLESTTYPTTTEDFMLPLISEATKSNPFFNETVIPNEAERSEGSHNTGTDPNLPPTGGLRGATPFWLAYSPERVDPGNKNYHTRNTPKVLGALTPEGLEIGQALYKKAVDTIHPVSSPRVAEMVKILENTYRLVNISLINELALLAGKMDINIWEVIEAAKTKPFGFEAFYPGPGVGGHCIPLDPFYLEHIAKRYNFDLSMIHAAGHINMRMPHYMYIKIAAALNRQQKAVSGSTILFLGVAFKPDINDERESPALRIMDILFFKDGKVTYHDPYIPEVQTNEGNTFYSLDLDEETIKNADCVVLTTNHSVFDIKKIQKHARLIVDLRNMIKEADDKVYKL